MGLLQIGGRLAGKPALLRTSTFMLLAVCFGNTAWTASSPDTYEDCPYFDDASITTKNTLTEGIEQSHTNHSIGDVDWARCYETVESGTTPYKLAFYLGALPTNSDVKVTLYKDGLSSPPQVYSLSWLDVGTTDNSVTWIGSSVKPVYFSVETSGSIEPQVQYNVTFGRNTGANNGLASGVGATYITVTWDTTGEPGDTVGYNVLRSTTGQPGSFVQANSSPELPPYLDTGLSPATVYFYKIERKKNDMTTVPWVGLFYGYTLPLAVCRATDWSCYE